jgi:hypothetical protein
LEALLDEAEKSVDYSEVTTSEFDAMEREAFDLLRKRKQALIMARAMQSCEMK